MGHVAHSVFSRLSLLLWLSVIMADILRATADGVEDATTQGLPASLTAAALAATACTVIQAVAGQRTLRPGYRALRLISVALWMMDVTTLAMRNTGGHHPPDYLLGYIFVIGVAAATATVCLAILSIGDGDKARLIRALAEASEPTAPQLQSDLRWANGASLPGGR